MHLRNLFHIAMACSFSCQVLVGQDQIMDADKMFLNARDVAFKGDYDGARKSLHKLLASYPDYVDASVLVAKTHSWQGDHDEARKRLNRITSKNRILEDAWVAAVKNEIYAENFNIALGLTAKALTYLEESAQLVALKGDVLKRIEKQQQVYDVLKSEEKEENRLNTISVLSSTEIFESTFKPMYQTSVEYRRKTKYGFVLPRLNHSERFDISGLQYEIDGYPKFSKKLHGYINYAFSDAQIFPKHKAGAEVYMELPKALEVSLGGRYLQFDDGGIAVVTGTFGMYRGNYYLSLRPNVALRSSKEISPSGSLLARKYIKNGLNYLSLNLSYGFDVEFNQFVADGVLLAETLLFIESGRLRFEYQFTDKQRQNVYGLNLGVNRQEFAFAPGTHIWSVAGGLKYQIRFK